MPCQMLLSFMFGNLAYNARKNTYYSKRQGTL